MNVEGTVFYKEGGVFMLQTIVEGIIRETSIEFFLFMVLAPIAIIIIRGFQGIGYYFTNTIRNMIILYIVILFVWFLKLKGINILN